MLKASEVERCGRVAFEPGTVFSFKPSESSSLHNDTGGLLKVYANGSRDAVIMKAGETLWFSHFDEPPR